MAADDQVRDQAEQAAIGAMLLAEHAIEAVADLLRPDDFYRPTNATIFTAVVKLHAADKPVDPITVAAALREAGDLDRVGGLPYLHTLMAAVPTAANAGYYAQQVADAAVRRRRILLTTRAHQAAEQDQPAALAAALRDLAELDTRTVGEPDRGTELDAFLAVDEPDYDWLIPGLLERGDRLILTGREGHDKSTLLRQIGTGRVVDGTG